MTRTLPDFSFETTAQEAAAALKDEIQGKNILITGTTINGIGFEAARAVAPYANLVVITGYNAERLERSEEALKQEFPSVNVRPLILDLSSLAAVRKAAEEVNAYSEPIHVLVHNAATMGSYYLTEDNLEIQMATAQFGPFLFTKLIAPKLLSARSAGDAAAFVPRVVYVASQAHARTTGINWDKFRLGYADDDVETRISHRLMKRYAEVKTANVLMAQELSRRAKGQLRAYSLHPGLVVTNAVDKGDVLPYYVDIESAHFTLPNNFLSTIRLTCSCIVFRKLVLAVDVGTTYSAASWCLLEPREEPKFGAVQRWPKQAAADLKVPTAILYDHEGEPRAFGAEVDDEATAFNAATNGWHRVEWFKLLLRPASLHSIHELDQCELPSNVKLDQVYADFLRFIGGQLKAGFKEAYARGDEMWDELRSSLEVILSHPNGWEGVQQARMRRAAVAANLVDEGNGAQVRFVTEAEASVLFAIGTGSIHEWMEPKSHVVVCDCGGGTVDITRYKIISKKPGLQLEESAPAKCTLFTLNAMPPLIDSGYLAGGVIVKQRALEFLKKHLSGTQWQDSVEQVIQQFDQNTKNKFSGGEALSYVSLGGGLNATDKEKGIERGMLRIPAATMATFFDDCIDEIKQGILDACEQPGTRRRVTDRVILVGGFASSPYVFSKLTQWGQLKSIKIIRPDGPTSKAVVQGALEWALGPTVRARIAKWHYGTDAYRRYESRNPEHAPFASRVVTVPSGIRYVPGAWDCIVRKVGLGAVLAGKIDRSLILFFKGTRLLADKEYRAQFVAELREDTINFEREETLYICSSKTPKEFVIGSDGNMNPGFQVLCTIKGDLRNCFEATPSYVSVGRSSGRYRRVMFDVCLKLGDTELSARLRWSENNKIVYGPATIVYNSQ
ncbi:hypothetical protein HMN09_01198800 [Mycena chlorophos]|uniref:Uncharacterized protein n=1 Tax=Mycena chlorophos TaxID=658473 RepID=A0A8H6VTB9_MYCCL|nr:hypothetical protein HMN09_01198800 [Mycena chlorophos]